MRGGRLISQLELGSWPSLGHLPRFLADEDNTVYSKHLIGSTRNSSTRFPEREAESSYLEVHEVAGVAEEASKLPKSLTPPHTTQ